MSETKFGVLSQLRIELPYESAEEQAEADKITLQLRCVGMRTCRVAYDWGFKSFEHIQPGSKPKVPDDAPHDPNRNMAALKSGDLVRIFKSVTDGDVHWEGTVNYSRRKYHHGLQKRMNPQAWVDMFYAGLPARVQRGDRILYGALDAFAETGTEGPIWSLQEYGKRGYDGLVVLENGDRLTAFRNVRDGEVEWEGPVDFGPEGVVKLEYHEVVRESRHMDTESWLQLYWERRPVALTPK